MEEKLEAYRARKNREALIKNYKDKIFGFFKKNKDDKESELLSTEHKPVLTHNDTDNEDETSSNATSCDYELETPADKFTYLRWIYYALCFILWASLYAIFIKLEFGIVYLIVSGIVFMCINTRTRKKLDNEVSAYSVFNKNCESIDGTLKAEQLEGQLIYGRLT